MVKRKAFAYITRHNRLLVLEHPHAPEAGIQVPAGTLQPDESPEIAVMREVSEETGLTDLKLCRFLGETVYDMSPFGKNEIHHRYFFHLQCQQDTPDSWTHFELHATDEPAPILFRLFWVTLPYTGLIAGHGAFLNRL